MPAWSRRRALRAAVLPLVAGLAGCSGETRVSRSAPADPREEPVTDYTVRQIRVPAPRPLYWSVNDTPSSDDPGRTHHVTSKSELDKLRFASEIPAVERLEAFVRSVDLETESVYLHAQTLEASYDLVLRGVSRDDSSVSVDLCRDLKPADATCNTGDDTAVALAIRLPFSGDDFHGIGMSYGNQCGPTRQPVHFEPSTPTTSRTEAGGGQ
ncbi:MAG: hypothetical protein R3324_18290 [Halobacteriales archaeon]|nr:hypothetical protein [Halobacteriales archaeon]